MENTELIIDRIKDFKDDNTIQHNQINNHLKTLNNSVAKIKRSQLLLRGIGIGVVGVLLLLGFLPQRVFDLIKSIF